MMLHHPSTVPAPTNASPAEFFEAILPKILAARSEAARTIGDRLLFEVVGEQGGCWFVDLANQRVFGGAPSKADCTVVMSSDTFTGFLRGSLDVAAAARERTVEVQGDLEALTRFSGLMLP